MERVALLVDCDPGVDDAIALFVAAHFGELVGITTVGGNVGIENTTHNALAVTQIAELDVGVHSGLAGPIASRGRGAQHVHGESGLGATELPALERCVKSTDAVGFILDASHRVPNLNLVAVGPLTNIAAALHQDPHLPTRLGSLTIMGGAAKGGNVTPAAEFNIWADPEAADTVFRIGGTITMVGLDVTEKVLLGTSEVERLMAANNPRAQLAAQLLEYAIERSGELRGWDGAPVHDACAVLAVTHPHLFDGALQNVNVELTGTHTRGMTVVDSRAVPSESQENARVIYDANAKAVRQLIIEAATSD